MNDSGPKAGQPHPAHARPPTGFELRPGPVLLVEDNADDVELTLRALKRNGITNPVVTLSDGVQALDYLLAQGDYAGRAAEQPEVVLLDLKLPRVDGLEVLAQLKSDPRLRMLPVVVLTSSSDERDVRRAYELGANSYVPKPGDFRNLIRVIHVLGTYWLGIVEPPPEINRPA